VVLEGDVRDIRARSPYRYADVDFADPVKWRPNLAGVEVASTDTTRIRLRVDPAVDPALLLADASATGTVASFSFAPPDLSEVFFAAVGRTPDTDGVAP
jgi:ABC-type uncharacterized transport system ATPase subunit